MSMVNLLVASRANRQHRIGVVCSLITHSVDMVNFKVGVASLGNKRCIFLTRFTDSIGTSKCIFSDRSGTLILCSCSSRA